MPLLPFQEVISRQTALSKAQLDPGLSFWLAKQQWRWRRGRLAAEQVLLLRLLGIEFDAYNLEAWRDAAHCTAAFLLGSNLRMVRFRFVRHSFASSTCQLVCYQSEFILAGQASWVQTELGYAEDHTLLLFGSVVILFG